MIFDFLCWMYLLQHFSLIRNLIYTISKAVKALRQCIPQNTANPWPSWVLHFFLHFHINPSHVPPGGPTGNIQVGGLPQLLTKVPSLTREDVICMSRLHIQLHLWQDPWAPARTEPQAMGRALREGGWLWRRPPGCKGSGEPGPDGRPRMLDHRDCDQ